MKILFSSGSLYGHINPMLALACAALEAGHDVRFATGADLAPHVRQRGLQTWSVGLTHAQAGGNHQASWLDYFADTAERRAAELVPRALAWQPDLVVHEETELAGPVVAALCAARHVVHGLGLMPRPAVWPKLMASMTRIALPWGLRDVVRHLAEATYLHLCPAALQSPAEDFWPHVLPLRPLMAAPLPDERLPKGFASLPFAHSIHLTLGTVFNGSVQVLRNAIGALRDLPYNLIVAVGPSGDPASLGRQPTHVRIERYLAHAVLLPHCRLVVSQGGAGVMFGALSLGLPQLVLPQGADQFVNAEALARAGAGRALQAEQATVGAIRQAAIQLVTQPRFAMAARTIEAEITAMPDARTTLRRLTGDDAAPRVAPTAASAGGTV